MIADRQDKVDSTVVGHLVSFRSKASQAKTLFHKVSGPPEIEIEFSEGIKISMKPSNSTTRLVHRLQEAKRKSCKVFKIGFQFPVHEFMIGDTRS